MILVTGGSGFIGRYLIKVLSCQGYDIVAVSRHIQNQNIDYPNVKVKNADITNKEALNNLPSEIDSVIHLAAYCSTKETFDENEKLLRVNVIGTSNVLNFCVERRINHIIYSSTISVYGPRQYKEIKETDSTYPISFYGMSKLLGEWYCNKIGIQYDITYCSLRFCAIYGFGEEPNRHALPLRFINQALANNDINVFGDGNSARDYLYIKDAVNAIIRAYQKKVCGIYNIGPGYAVKVRDLAKMVSIIFSEGKSKLIFETSKKEDLSETYLDISKAKNDLNFKPEYTIENGLKDYYHEILRKKR